ncbi:RusA family crossover junction endodeoxyribonuclease [bacterium]|nr:RusA family crossover junction endodeoxyribonuclease [bacterium]
MMSYQLLVSYDQVPPSENHIRVSVGPRLIYTREAVQFESGFMRHLSEHHALDLGAILGEFKKDPYMVFEVTIQIYNPVFTEGFKSGKAKSPYRMQDCANRQKLVLDALARSFGVDQARRCIIDDSRFVRVIIEQHHSHKPRINVCMRKLTGWWDEEGRDAAAKPI